MTEPKVSQPGDTETNRTNPVDLDRLDQLRTQATPGPWEVISAGDPWGWWAIDHPDSDATERYVIQPEGDLAKPDAEYITALANTHPAMAAEIRELRRARAIAWEQGYYRGVKDETLELERADNPYLNGDQT